MTNPVVDEIWRIVTEALNSSQKRFQVHVFPFRMTDANLANNRRHPWYEFWNNLKSGHDLFLETSVPPKVSVCEQAYVFEPGEVGSDGAAKLKKHCLPEIVGRLGVRS